MAASRWGPARSLGLLPAAAVAKIRAGKGKLDSAQDCVELAALFGKNAAALRGKSPVTAAQIKERRTSAPSF